MSANLKLLDQFKLLGNLETNFVCELSQDDRTFIVAESGVFIIPQKPNLNSIFPEYSCQKFLLKPSSFALCAEVEIDINSFLHELPKDVIIETVANIGLSQNLKDATPVPPSVLFAQWSSAYMVDGAFSMLGILTNLYSLEIYIKNTSESNLIEYRMILNVTQEILKNRKNEFVYSNRLPPLQKMRELKKRIEFIAPLTFQWSHTFLCGSQNCAVIFVGHYHGDISLWKIFSITTNDESTYCKFICRYKSKMGNIASLYWHQTSQFSGALCVGDSAGKISVLHVHELDKNCSIDREINLYSEEDKQVDKITVMAFENYTVLVTVKQTYLLLYVLNTTGHIIDFVVHNVGNFYITGLNHHKNILRVLTFTGVFKELHLSVHCNKLNIRESTIPVKFDFSGYKTHGLVVSSNRVLYNFIVAPCHIKTSMQGEIKIKRFLGFLLFHNVNVNPLELLLENQTGSLRRFWDCFETLRIICIKEQRFPWLGLASYMDLNNLDTLTLVQLKTLRIIAKISETVFEVITRVTSYDIKPYILLHYLVDMKLILQRLARIFNEIDTGKQLSLFQLRSMDLQVFFLKEMVISGILPKAQVGKTFVEEVSHILTIANEIKYPDICQCNFCGEKLIGSMCLPPHTDSRCVFTMMPIFIAPAYKCLFCNSLAHIEMVKEEKPLLCPYCDYPMEMVALDKKIAEQMNEVEKVFNKNGIESRCVSDCIRDSDSVKEDIFLSLEDDDRTFVNISDDEETSDSNELEKLYFKLSNVNISDNVSLSTNQDMDPI